MECETCIRKGVKMLVEHTVIGHTVIGVFVRRGVIVGYYVYLNGMLRPNYETPTSMLKLLQRRKGFFSNAELQDGKVVLLPNVNEYPQVVFTEEEIKPDDIRDYLRVQEVKEIERKDIYVVLENKLSTEGYVVIVNICGQMKKVSCTDMVKYKFANVDVYKRPKSKQYKGQYAIRKKRCKK